MLWLITQNPSRSIEIMCKDTPAEVCYWCSWRKIKMLRMTSTLPYKYLRTTLHITSIWQNSTLWMDLKKMPENALKVAWAFFPKRDSLFTVKNFHFLKIESEYIERSEMTIMKYNKKSNKYIHSIHSIITNLQNSWVKLVRDTWKYLSWKQHLQQALLLIAKITNFN